jgi:hypothetical protein
MFVSVLFFCLYFGTKKIIPNSTFIIYMSTDNSYLCVFSVLVSEIVFSTLALAISLREKDRFRIYFNSCRGKPSRNDGCCVSIAYIAYIGRV